MLEPPSKVERAMLPSYLLFLIQKKQMILENLNFQSWLMQAIAKLSGTIMWKWRKSEREVGYKLQWFNNCKCTTTTHFAVHTVLAINDLPSHRWLYCSLGVCCCFSVKYWEVIIKCIPLSSKLLCESSGKLNLGVLTLQEFRCQKMHILGWFK